MRISLAALSTSLVLLAACDVIVEHWPPPGSGGGGSGSGPALVIGGSPEGFQVFEADQKRNNPRAGEPWYVILTSGREAVRLDGPPVASATGFFALEEPQIMQDRTGFTVRANSRLSYRVDIQDFEWEIGLARVELRQQDQVIATSFYFTAHGDGVAHQVTITPIIDGGNRGASTPPVTIETRR